MKSEKALVTACNIRFLTGAETLLRNARDLMPEIARYCYTLPPEQDEVRRQIGDLAEVLPMPRMVEGVPPDMQIAVARVFTPRVPAEVAAWMDCDCILCRPARELWEVPAGKVRAVRDNALRISDTLAMAPAVTAMLERLFPGAPEKRGFNSGVFSLRTAEWHDLPERFERALREGGLSFYHLGFDQPLLSAMMLPSVEWLPYEFNAHHLFDYPIPRKVRVVHYTSPAKPWMPEYPRHEPAYYHWVRYGLGERRRWVLLWVWFRILLRTPLRLWMRRLRAGSAR